MRNLLLLYIILIFSVGYCGAEDKIITSAGDPWPPFVAPSPPDEGLSLAIIRAAFATQGYKVEMKYVPWARAEIEVREGKFDILPNTWQTEERKKAFLFSEPYAVNKIKFIKLVDDPFEYSDLESLTGKKIGIVRGYGYDENFLKADNFVRESVDKFILNIKKLTVSPKRIDLAIEDEIVARVKIAKENPELLNKIRFTRNALSYQNLHIVSGLGNPRHVEIITIFNKGLAEITANGTYKRILNNMGLLTLSPNPKKEITDQPETGKKCNARPPGLTTEKAR